MAKLTLCLVLVGFLWFGTAQAAAPALHWVRAPGAERCIEPAALAERVEALSGTAFVAPAVAELSLEGLVEPAGKGFRVHLSSSRRGQARSAERVLSTKSPNCRELDAAVSFVIALTIDPGLSLSGVPSDVLAAFGQELPPEQTLLAELDRLPPVPVRAPALEPSRPSPAPSAPPAAPKPARYGFGLAGAALGGSAPGWLGGVRASFGLVLARRVSLGLALGAFPSLRAQPVSAQRSAAFQSYDAALSACPGLRRGRWTGLGCAGIALGYLRARGLDFEKNHSAALWDPAAAFALSAAVSLAHGVGLFTSAGLHVRFLSQTFELASGGAPAEQAYHPPRVAGLFSLGPRYEF